MFVGKQVILGWLNSALQLRLERIEDVSAGLGTGSGSVTNRRRVTGQGSAGQQQRAGLSLLHLIVT